LTSTGLFWGQVKWLTLWRSDTRLWWWIFLIQAFHHRWIVVFTYRRMKILWTDDHWIDSTTFELLWFWWGIEFRILFVFLLVVIFVRNVKIMPLNLRRIHNLSRYVWQHMLSIIYRSHLSWYVARWILSELLSLLSIISIVYQIIEFYFHLHLINIAIQWWSHNILLIILISLNIIDTTSVRSEFWWHLARYI
jgi:hypothetical protein